MIVTLIGFMGTGKTSVGKRLAQKMNYQYIDLDQYIEEKTNNSVKEIFKDNGEQYFRNLEKKYLAEVIEQDEKLILSPGGGIVLVQENIDLIKKKTFPILLKASPQVIMKRVNNIKDRPLLDKEDTLQRIKQLLNQRMKYYNQFTTVVDTDYNEIEEVINRIVDILER